MCRLLRRPADRSVADVALFGSVDPDLQVFGTLAGQLREQQPSVHRINAAMGINFVGPG